MPKPWRLVPGSRYEQLDLLAVKQPTWTESHGIPEPPDTARAAALDRLAREHAARHGWGKDTLGRARLGLKVVLGLQETPGARFRVSDIMAQLSPHPIPASPVLAVLIEASMLEDDRTPAIQLWFERQIIALPPQMTDELRVWFEVMHHGSTVPPRSRPRAPVTITTRTRWALPALQSWGKAGHSSLREITRADVAAALPPSGNERATLGLALRSIFGTLRGRKLIFTNPIAHIKIGEIERRQPLPLNPSDIRGLLDSPDSAAAAVAALIAFHGLRPEELRGLQLTDIRDGRIWLPDRSVPLAEPVEQRVATWLDERGRRWPNTANAHLFIHLHTACDTGPIGRGWFWRHLPIAPTKIRDDRLLDEAQATSGDVRRISDFFGVTVKAAVRYAATLDHPGLVNREQPERPR